MALPLDEIKKLIKEGIPDAKIEIKDLMGDNNHYSAVIKSQVFKNLNKVEQHKLVYKSLKGKMGNELHALSITTKTE
jgi:stress-induced morphogen|tara:strand:+ start:281 stop:511 length:231 start_codon:yes stop_codon:yes gene_type:complete